MSNAEIFLNHFTEIESWLKQKIKEQSDRENEWLSFTEMIRELKFKNPLVKQFFDDLYQFASLRNAIIHIRKGNKPIAEPLNDTVTDIEHIKNELLRPPKIKLNTSIFSVTEESGIDEFLIAIRDLNYSQIPIIDQSHKVFEVINTNTVARWLSAETLEDIISLKETKIKDLIPHIEYQKNFSFISRESNYYEAAELFLNYSNEKHHNLDALFITQNGYPNNKLLGIICFEDVATYFKK